MCGGHWKRWRGEIGGGRTGKEDEKVLFFFLNKKIFFYLNIYYYNYFIHQSPRNNTFQLLTSLFYFC
jgi:hypothetical protein